MLVAHSAILLLYSKESVNRKVTLPIWADILGALLILVTAFIYLLPDYELLVLPAIAIVTIPLITILYKCDQKEDSDKQITCCDCCQ